MTKTRWLALAAAIFFASAFWVAAQSQDTAKDPVCGMSVKKDGARWTYDYKGTTYYFCSEGCRIEFSKNPEKYLAPGAEAKPMGKMAGQGMMPGQMHGQAQAAAGGMMAECPMMLPDVERKVETIKDGLIITLTSKNAETVKKLQEHAAKMKDGQCPMMKNDRR
jgi:YHS domain-containing protein